MKLRAVLSTYLNRFPEDAKNLRLLQDQLADNEVVRTRTNFRGHLTASGIVLNAERTAILMIHHAGFDMWLQPGGHVEVEDVDLLAAARREVVEETGIQDIEQIVLLDNPSMPLHIDTQYIPPNSKKNEPEHYHHDFRYLFVAKTGDTTPQLEEVHAVEWVPLADERAKAIGGALPRLHELGIIPPQK